MYLKGTNAHQDKKLFRIYITHYSSQEAKGKLCLITKVLVLVQVDGQAGTAMTHEARTFSGQQWVSLFPQGLVISKPLK